MPRRYGNEALAWAAGLLDGKGSLYCKRRAVNTHKRPVLALSFQLVDRETLERFAATVGCPGTLCKIQRPTAGGSTVWQLQYNGRRAESVVSAIEPWLGSRRLEQLAAIREELEEVV
jgi:hypothetical protein